MSAKASSTGNSVDTATTAIKSDRNRSARSDSSRSALMAASAAGVGGSMDSDGLGVALDRDGHHLGLQKKISKMMRAIPQMSTVA